MAAAVLILSLGTPPASGPAPCQDCGCGQCECGPTEVEGAPADTSTVSYWSSENAQPAQSPARAAVIDAVESIAQRKLDRVKRELL